MKIRKLSLLAIFTVFMFYSCTNMPSKEVKPMPLSTELTIPLSDITLSGDTSEFKPSWVEKIVSPGIREHVLSIKATTPTVPPKLTLSFSFPSDDVAQYWNPGNKMDKVNYYYNSITSRASAGAPVLCFLNSRNQNRLTIACSDALNQVSIYSELVEEDARFHITIKLFNERLPAMEDYEFIVRLDSRNNHFNEALEGVSNWWGQMENYKPATVPDDAKHPMYSTWYSFHQNLNVPKILSELKEARNLGMTAIIVDDGWQTMDNQRGYAYTGDWKPVRIPDMKYFVDEVHDLDMKFLLWYSLPFVGEKSENYKRFKGKYLRFWESQGTYVLDPRYPEVREFIIQTYEKALVDWKLDGFKLDFLGWFRANNQTELTAENGRDIASVNQAVDMLMTDIMDRLKEINPTIMIEFRQPYTGPLMRKYGNMLRASDCPNMAIVNRVRTTDLRLIAGNTAVHSDMFMWHKDDPVENAALQILNILFSVPQLSVMLDSLSAEQLEMTKYYLNYWANNRAILLDGRFRANDPGALYPVLRASNTEKEIIAVYNDVFVTVDESKNKIDIVNAKGSTTVVVDFTNPYGSYNVEILDCLGNVIHNYESNITGIEKYSVPASGMIKLSKS